MVCSKLLKAFCDFCVFLYIDISMTCVMYIHSASMSVYVHVVPDRDVLVCGKYIGVICV